MFCARGCGKLTTTRESQGVEFVCGLARNQKLRRIIGAQMHAATQQWQETGTPARVFSEFDYQAKKTKKGGWDRGRRVDAANGAPEVFPGCHLA